MADDLGVSVRIEQFQGQWLALSREDRTRLVSVKHQPSLLGGHTVLGSRVWNVQDRFRVVLGPLTIQKYLRLIPDGDSFTRLCELVRSYVGPQFDFDIQPILRADQVPSCRLTHANDTPRLGRTTFASSQPFEKDFDGAVFEGVEIGVNPIESQYSLRV